MLFHFTPPFLCLSTICLILTHPPTPPHLPPPPPTPQIFATHWTAVASALQGVPGLLGYEMLNEPWSAPPYNATSTLASSQLSSLPPAFSDQSSLGTLYDTLHAAVRAVVRCRIAVLYHYYMLLTPSVLMMALDSSVYVFRAPCLVLFFAVLLYFFPKDNDTLFFFEPLVLESYEAVSRQYTTDFTPGGPGASSAQQQQQPNDDDLKKNVLAYHSYCPPGANNSSPNLPLCKVLVNSSWAGVKRNLNHMGSSVKAQILYEQIQSHLKQRCTILSEQECSCLDHILCISKLHSIVLLHHFHCVAVRMRVRAYIKFKGRGHVDRVWRSGRS